METFSATPVPWEMCKQLTRAQFTPFQRVGLSFLQTQLLFNRGLKTPEEMRAFLDARLDRIPDPRQFTDMASALERVQRALRTHEHVTIYGDFDADGVTSAALLTRALSRLGQPAPLLSSYIPSRLQGTRGLDRTALDLLKARGTTLVITTDCGSSDVEEVAYAQGQGIDIIITDHHHPPAQLPRATAMLNPWRPDCTYGERYLCGVGIAFKLAQALYRAYRREGELWDLLDLVAVGTVGDVALLQGENHTLVRAGMQQLNHTTNAGLQALIKVARLTPGRIRERDISFVLAPRLNAAGRMKHADLAFRLLTTDDVAEAEALAAELDGLNASRQQQTEELMHLARLQAEQQADKQVILIAGDKEHWPEGIIGLVAGKLAEETGRPTFVLSQDGAFSRGSARSPLDFNLILALQAARPLLLARFGGHAQAAGFTIANELVPELHAHLLRCYEEARNGHPMNGNAMTTDAPPDLAAEAESTPPAPVRKIDLVIPKPSLINMQTLQEIMLLGPFGAGHPEPIFRADGLYIQKRWSSGNERQHLRVRLRGPHNLSFEGTLRQGSSLLPLLKEGAQVQVIFALEPSWSRPESDLSLKILEITPVETEV